MILVAGSSNTDMIIRVPRIPKAGETILGGKFSVSAGGKGANQAVAAARMGADVSFVARMGNDALGQEALANLQKDAIDVSLIQFDPDASSGVALIYVGDDGENSIAVAPGANATLTPDKLVDFDPVLARADLILLQLEIPLATVEFLAKSAAACNVPVILNPAPSAALSSDLLRYVDYLTPNQTEATHLTGIVIDSYESAIKAGKKLLSQGVRHVIITMGSSGVALITPDYHRHIPAYSVKPVDTTGAGDTFNGAFAAGLSAGKSLGEALGVACAAAALSVTKLGAQLSIPRRDDVTTFLASQT